ncbi:MAG: prepilin-type N-terminal cleavage/methylation domain-containing protein [Desulfatirhabdiaceae bacterium]
MMENQVSNKGFTLIEVLMAIIILAIGLLSLSQLSAYTIRSNAAASHFTRATVMAHDKLETLKRIYRTDPTASQTIALLSNGGDNTDISTNVHSNTALFTSPDHTDTCNSGCSITIDSSLKRAWNIADNTPGPGMKTVTVIVGWNDSANHFVALSTIITEK